MRCESCGWSFVMKDKFSYQCSGFVNGKICDNRYRCRGAILAVRRGSDSNTASAMRAFVRCP